MKWYLLLPLISLSLSPSLWAAETTLPPPTEASPSVSVEAPDTETHEPASYLRITESTNGVHTLEVAWRSFKAPSDSEPLLWLGGVSHIGDSNYYARLQERLNEADLVLYEGVDEATAAGEAKPFADEPTRDDGMQSVLADMLGLVFQLNHIDYSPEHFEHCDMDIDTLMAELAGDENPTNQTSEAFDQLNAQLSGAGASVKLLEVVGIFLKAMPQAQSVVKLLLIETLGNVPSDMSQIQGMPPEILELMEVLLNRRNEIVLARVATLKDDLSGDQTATIFYGAAHNSHLEQELVKQGYQQQNEEWFPAMSVNLSDTGLSSAQVLFFRQLIQSQLGN